MIFIWGLPPAAGATLQGSQVCSALRKIRFAHFAGSAASPPPFASLGRLAFGHSCRLKPAAN
ncbi:hypothetical protein SGRA_0844 [Saprospira grandis str. Lewin]|uniref:Uncharacterized protein n=1 Tax=Saprospira grandis (strain Lewin) TaxID=984262 RepID=H6L244_SAPGL|nr:hypothetical protein SGRA_0844 [Saprospira grandis str. Lewin]